MVPMGTSCSANQGGFFLSDQEGKVDPLQERDDIIAKLQEQVEISTGKLLDEQWFAEQLTKELAKEQENGKKLQDEFAGAAMRATEARIESSLAQTILGRREAEKINQDEGWEGYKPHDGVVTVPKTAPDADAGLTVLLFGMTGCGKSSLGNLIVGDKIFHASDDTTSVTKLDSLLKFTTDDGSLMLLDTIGLGDTDLSQDQVVNSIRDVALQAPHGIDILFYVMRNERLTDDAIARFIYITQFLWGDKCLDNLYIVVTHATRYATDKKEAQNWITRQVEMNWRFKHIYSMVGNNPSSFLFVDNPDSESKEPFWLQRQDNSRRTVLHLLATHPRDVIPPFTHSMMKQAKELGESLGSSRKGEIEKKEREIQTMKTKLEAKSKQLEQMSAFQGVGKKVDPKKLEAMQREVTKLEKDLKKNRAAKEQLKQEETADLIANAKTNKKFNAAVENEAKKATTSFSFNFIPSMQNAKGGVNKVTGEASKACWRLACSFGVGGLWGNKNTKKSKAGASKEDNEPDSWIPKEFLEHAKQMNAEEKKALLDSAAGGAP